jgi:hypothetical protein
VLPFCGLPPLPASRSPSASCCPLSVPGAAGAAPRPRGDQALVWEEGNRWRLTLRSGHETGASLRPFVFLQPWLVILHFRRDDGRASRLVLLPDMLDEDSCRRLRVRLLIDMKQIANPGAR